MKKTAAILITNGFLLAFACVAVSAQDEEIKFTDIKVVKNRQSVIKGTVKEGKEIYYAFEAKGEKTFRVKIIGQSAEFQLVSGSEYEIYPFTEWVKSYNGKADSDLSINTWIIKVRSTHKFAKFTLMILVK